MTQKTHVDAQVHVNCKTKYKTHTEKNTNNIYIARLRVLMSEYGLPVSS
jgi:hypothetical protein